MSHGCGLWHPVILQYTVPVFRSIDKRFDKMIKLIILNTDFICVKNWFHCIIRSKYSTVNVARRLNRSGRLHCSRHQRRRPCQEN